MEYDGITRLTDDHRRVERLYERAQEPGADRRAVIDEIVRELSIHDAIEKQHLYPKVRERITGGANLADRSLAEHHTVEELLAALDRAGDDLEAVWPILQETMVRVADHVAEEEAHIFPELRDLLRPQELENLWFDLDRARMRAPTRPHPAAPDRGVGAKVVGAAAGLVDRARDPAAVRPARREQE